MKKVKSRTTALNRSRASLVNPAQARMAAAQDRNQYADSGSVLGNLKQSAKRAAKWGVARISDAANQFIDGFGDYSVTSNTLVAGNSVPNFRQGSDGIRICHREFCFNLTGSAAFGIANPNYVANTDPTVNQQSIAINPCNSKLFPWLSSVAINFDEYELKGIIFEYKPTSGTYAGASNSAALGAVIFATQYDVFARPFTSKVLAESYEYSTSTVPFASMIHPVECDPGLNMLKTHYTWQEVDAPPIVASQMPFFNHGNFMAMAEGMASSYICGEVWVSYDVVFKKPRINTVGSLDIVHFVSNPVNTVAAGLACGSVGMITQSGGISGVRWNNVVANTLAFILAETGIYKVDFVLVCSGNTGNLTVNVGSNITGRLDYNGQANAYIYFYEAGGAILTDIVSVDTSGTGAANTITVTMAAGVAAGDFDVIVTRLPSTYT